MEQEIYYKARIILNSHSFRNDIIVNNLKKRFSIISINNKNKKELEIEITTQYNAYYSKGKIKKWLFGEILRDTNFYSLNVLECKEESEIYNTEIKCI